MQHGVGPRRAAGAGSTRAADRARARSPRCSSPTATGSAASPSAAAQLLRGLTFAGTHPALIAGEPLTPDEIVSVLLDGIRADRPWTPAEPRADPPPPRPTCAAYRRLLIAVFVLQFVQAMATLFLPTLNADIIDKGVLTGDTQLHLVDRRP